MTNRAIPTARGGFVDTGAIYLSADGKTVELLEWSEELERSDFDAAQAACAALGDGWRAPTPHEWTGIVNYDKEMPATDAPGIKSDWYWTNQRDLVSPAAYAVCVSLPDGYVLWSDQDDGGRVRAVRRVRASQYLKLEI